MRRLWCRSRRRRLVHLDISAGTSPTRLLLLRVNEKRAVAKHREFASMVPVRLSPSSVISVTVEVGPSQTTPVQRWRHGSELVFHPLSIELLVGERCVMNRTRASLTSLVSPPDVVMMRNHTVKTIGVRTIILMVVKLKWLVDWSFELYRGRKLSI